MGALTEALLNAGAHVVAVEKDDVLAENLKKLQTPDHRLTVYNADITKIALDTIVKGKAKVVSNLPFHITTPIMALLLERYDLFIKLVVMVQEEVARRYQARPHGEDYNAFTVLMNFYGHVDDVFRVSKHCFYPAPAIDAAVMTLSLHEPPYVQDHAAFFAFVKEAFCHRRKSLKASLKKQYPPATISHALESMHKSPNTRPEELSLTEFLSLFHKISRPKD